MSPESKYRPDIDGLRAIAVGCVIGFHAFPNLVKGGFVGVDIFFVISGFLISSIIFQALETGHFSYRDFYARRIRRIFPALVTVCLSVFVVGWLVLLPDEFALLGKHLAAGAAFVSNLVFWAEAGYFDPAADSKPLLHLWSLGVEEQFYIVWPLVLAFVWRRKVGFLLVTTAIAAMSFAINVASVNADPTAAFYSPLSRFWELMIGGVAAYVAMHRGDLLRRGHALRSTLGAAAIACAVLWLDKQRSFPGYWALLPTLGAALMISAPQGWLNRQVLARRPMVWLGLVSYPLYLWHWPVLVYAKIVKGELLSPIERVEAVGAAVVLAALTYYLVERRLRHASLQAMPQRLAAAMAVVAAGALSVMLGQFAPRQHGSHISQILAARYDWEYPPTAARSHDFGSLRYFVVNNRAGAFTLFLGDSNMEQYGPRIDAVIRAHPQDSNGAILVGNQNRCNLLADILAGTGACPQAIERVRALAAEPSTHDLVVVASWANFSAQLADPDSRRRLADFLRSTGPGHRLYLLRNIPSGPELSPTSMFTGSRLTHIEPASRGQVAFDLSGFRQRFDGINDQLDAIAREAGAQVIDPVGFLCRTSACPVLDAAGTPLYLDAGHLTRRYSARAAVYIDLTMAVGEPKVAAKSRTDP